MDRAYTFVEGGYERFDVEEDSPYETLGPSDGGWLRGSLAIGESFYVHGRLDHVEGEETLPYAVYAPPGVYFPGDPITVFQPRLSERRTEGELGLGYHAAIGPRADFVSEIAYVATRSVGTPSFYYYTGRTNERAGRVSAGVRGDLTARLEGIAMVDVHRRSTLNDLGFSVGLQYRVTPRWGIVGGYEYSEYFQWLRTHRATLGLRASF